MDPEASASKAEPKSLVDDPESPQRVGTGSTARNSHYGTQRLERRSRPTSEASRGTSRSRGGKRVSYHDQPQHVSEEAMPPPIPTQKIAPDLEGAQGGDAQASNQEPPNFSRHPSHRTIRSRPDDDYNLTEDRIPPPVTSQAREEPTLEREQQSSDESFGPYTPRHPDDYQHQRKPVRQASGWLLQLYTVSHLIFFAIMGTLARLGMQWLTFYPGTPIVTPVIWANFTGSFFFGFLAEDKRLFMDAWSPDPSSRSEKRSSKRSDVSNEPPQVTAAERMKIKKTIPLYNGLATGFCGSFTSFSSFQRDVFLALSNNLPTPVNHPYTASTQVTNSSTVSRNGGYSFMALVAVVISTIALSLGGLIIGAHVALFLGRFTPRLSSRLSALILDPLMLLLGWGSWLGAVFLAIWPPDRFGGNEQWRGTVLFALVFAPLGCLLRFYASLKLNPLVPSFPLGTFAVNMFGTAIEGMCYDIQHVGVGVMGMVGGGRVGCQVLQGVQDGFCGCLTTVSTWVGEINGLKRRNGYVYAFGSVVGGLCLMVVIMGSVRWTVGFESPVCDTGYPNKYI